MNNTVRIAIVDPIDPSRNSIKNLLLGIDWVWLEAECSRYEFFSEIVEQTGPDVALISLDADAQRGLALVAEVALAHPTCAVMVVSKSQEGSLILQAMRNGAKEFLSAPLRLDDFMSALDRIRGASGNKQGKSKTSRIVTLVGASGGVGCTSLAVNLGCALAMNEENSVAVIDLDLALGDADVWLDIIPDYTIQNARINTQHLIGVAVGVPVRRRVGEDGVCPSDKIEMDRKFLFENCIDVADKRLNRGKRLGLSTEEARVLCRRCDRQTIVLKFVTNTYVVSNRRRQHDAAFQSLRKQSAPSLALEG